MIRKNPKSHTYTIGALTVIVIISMAFTGNWYMNGRQQQQQTGNDYAAKQPVNIPLNIESSEQLGNLVPAQGRTNLQSSNPGAALQSAGNMQVYNSFESGSGALHRQGSKVQ